MPTVGFRVYLARPSRPELVIDVYAGDPSAPDAVADALELAKRLALEPEAAVVRLVAAQGGELVVHEERVA